MRGEGIVFGTAASPRGSAPLIRSREGGPVPAQPPGYPPPTDPNPKNSKNPKNSRYAPIDYDEDDDAAAGGADFDGEMMSGMMSGEGADKAEGGLVEVPRQVQRNAITYARAAKQVTFVRRPAAPRG
eukprot:206929-Prorocentrum_minimum.AAC.1